MKTRIYIISAFILFALMTSCDKNFLEKNPPTLISAGNFWSSESEVQMGLAGCYTRLKGSYLTWSRSTLDAMVDNGYSKGYFADNYTVQTGTLDPVNCNIPNGVYSASYAGIASCNVFLANFKKANLNAAKANVYEAEARFLRAFFYFELAQRWGGVVIYKETPATIDDYKIAKSTEAEVFAFIAEDLTFAVANLPDTKYSTGHAMKTSALALQARIALFQGQYDNVITLTNAITSSVAGYTLATDLRSIFVKQEGQATCPEIIFSVKYLATNDGKQNEVDVGSEVCLFRESGLNPSKDLMNEYEAGDLRATRWFYSCPDKYTFVRYTDGFVYTGNEMMATQYGTQKFAAIFDPLLYQSAMRSIITGHDFVFIRLADVYLMYAEAQVEKAGGTTSDAKALQYINAIRSRAGLTTPYTSLTRDNLRKERRREMAMEGLRFYDIKRWKIGTTLTGKEIYNNGGVSYKMTWNDKMYYWPFSQSEMDINKKLVNNTGY